MKGSWKDLTIRDYDGIRFALNSNKTDSEKDIDILSILSGKGVDVIRDMNPSDVSEMMDVAKFILTPADVEPVDEFQYGGYKFCTKGIEDITYGQLTDIEHCGDSYSRLLGCILVPVGHKYQDGYQIDFGGIPFKIAKGVIDPFLDGLMGSTQRIIKSTLRKLRVRKLMRPSLTQVINLLKDTQSLLSCMQFRI